MDWFKKRNQGPSKQPSRREIPTGLWVKCERCEAILYRAELKRNHSVCSKCGYHFKIGSKEYIDLLLDPDSFEEHDAGLLTLDPLAFKEKRDYTDTIKTYQKNTGLRETAVTGMGRIENRPVSFTVFDGHFLGGSMGSVAGEKVARSIQRAIERRCPLVIVSTSGGARIHEGIYALMQMPKTALWLTRLSQARVPYISILTNPTMAGVMASFASLGDFTLAEPGAMIGFTGLRVIEQTIGSSLPEGFQTAEFFLDHGFVDQVVPRMQLRETVVKILGFFPDNAPR